VDPLGTRVNRNPEARGGQQLSPTTNAAESHVTRVPFGYMSIPSNTPQLRIRHVYKCVRGVDHPYPDLLAVVQRPAI